MFGYKCILIFIRMYQMLQNLLTNSHACVIIVNSLFSKGHAVAHLVEELSRKVAGSIPDGVIGIFH